MGWEGERGGKEIGFFAREEGKSTWGDIMLCKKKIQNKEGIDFCL